MAENVKKNPGTLRAGFMQTIAGDWPVCPGDRSVCPGDRSVCPLWTHQSVPARTHRPVPARTSQACPQDCFTRSDGAVIQNWHRYFVTALKLLRMNVCGSCGHAEAQFVISRSPVRPPAGGSIPYLMRAIVLVGQIDEQHQLRADAPIDLPPGQVRLVMRTADEDEAGASWSSGISEAWRDQLSDARQDIAATERKCRMLDSWVSLHSFGIGFRQNPIQSIRG